MLTSTKTTLSLSSKCRLLKSFPCTRLLPSWRYATTLADINVAERTREFRNICRDIELTLKMQQPYLQTNELRRKLVNLTYEKNYPVRVLVVGDFTTGKRRLLGSLLSMNALSIAKVAVIKASEVSETVADELLRVDPDVQVISPISQHANDWLKDSNVEFVYCSSECIFKKNIFQNIVSNVDMALIVSDSFRLLNSPAEKVILQNIKHLNKIYVITKAKSFEAPEALILQVLAEKLGLLENSRVSLEKRKPDLPIYFLKDVENPMPVKNALEKWLQNNGEDTKFQLDVEKLEEFAQEGKQEMANLLENLAIIEKKLTHIEQLIQKEWISISSIIKQRGLQVLNREFSNHKNRLTSFFDIYTFYSLPWKLDWIAEDLDKTRESDFLEETEHSMSYCMGYMNEHILTTMDKVNALLEMLSEDSSKPYYQKLKLSEITQYQQKKEESSLSDPFSLCNLVWREKLKYQQKSGFDDIEQSAKNIVIKGIGIQTSAICFGSSLYFNSVNPTICTFTFGILSLLGLSYMKIKWRAIETAIIRNADKCYTSIQLGIQEKVESMLNMSFKAKRKEISFAKDQLEKVIQSLSESETKLLGELNRIKNLKDSLKN